jgi:hypothetical protein
MFPLYDELLEQIFLYAVSHSGQVTITSLSYGSPASPYSISHVCARWRCVALNQPRLWSHLSVIKPANNGTGNLVREWINRAGSHPLHLSLRAGAASNMAAWAVLRVYLASISQCRSFEAQACKLPPSLPITVCPQDLALLRNFSISLDNPSILESTFLPLLRAAQNLLSLTWIGLHHLPLDQVCHSWGNLRELTLSSAQALEPLVRAISYCQELERLTLHQRIVCPQFNIPIITLPRLTYFRVPFQPFVRTIFDYLIAPSLKELEILVPNYAYWQQLATFLVRSNATLEVLRVHDFYGWCDSFDEPLFFDTLRMDCFDNLKELELTVLIGHHAITVLTQTGLVPHLHRLSLTLSRQPWSLLATALTNLVVSRGGSLDGRLMDESFEEEMTFIGRNTQLTFRWQGVSDSVDEENIYKTIY